MADDRGIRLVRIYDINIDCMRWEALSDLWKEDQWPAGVSDRLELSYDELMEIYKNKLPKTASA